MTLVHAGYGAALMRNFLTSGLDSAQSDCISV